MTKLQQFKLPLLACSSLLLFSGGLVAGDDRGKLIIDDKMPVQASPWTVCNVFDHSTLYESDSGFIRKVRVQGRYHGQYITQSEDVNGVRVNGFHAWQHRRFRLGLNIDMANDLNLFIDPNIANSAKLTDPFYDDYQTFQLTWEPKKNHFIMIGKLKQNFTREDTESSKRIKTVERAHIVNEVAEARPWGVIVGFDTGDRLHHELGGWLYGAHADSPQWIDFQSNGGFSYNLSYQLNDSTSLHFDYVYADQGPGYTTGAGGPAASEFGPQYEHAFALGTEVNKDRFQMIADLVYADNRVGSGGVPAGSDTWGLYVLPSYDITEKLEAVFRYGYMDQGRNQRTQRFPVRQPLENYHTFYVGMQYFICGEKLKLMAGYEYATGTVFGTGNDIDSGSWQFGVRTYF